MAGNGGMQPVRDEPPMYEGSATGNGGNSCITNVDECKILDQTIMDAPYRSGDLSNEDDSHVQGVYRENDFAGS